MHKVIRDTVPVQVPVDCDPTWIWDALQSPRVIKLIRDEQLMGECFVESRSFNDITRIATIDPATVGFIIKDISVSVLGEIRATVDRVELSKYQVMRTYGSLHYVARMLGNADNPTESKGTFITIDCIAKRTDLRHYPGYIL